jgi:hypothetical protein
MGGPAALDASETGHPTQPPATPPPVGAPGGRRVLILTLWTDFTVTRFPVLAGCVITCPVADWAHPATSTPVSGEEPARYHSWQRLASASLLVLFDVLLWIDVLSFDACGMA